MIWPSWHKLQGIVIWLGLDVLAVAVFFVWGALVLMWRSRPRPKPRVWNGKEIV